MGRLSRQWPKANDGSPSYTPPSTRSHRNFGISPRVATCILAFFVFFNFLLFTLGITITVAQGKWRWEGTSARKNGVEWHVDDRHTISSDVRAGVFFLWCGPPLLALGLSIFNIVTRHNLTARRAVFSAGTGTTLYVFAFILWRECAYSSPYNSALYPVCQHRPNHEKWFSDNWLNPLAIIWVLPWFAFSAIIIYLASSVLALVALRRQYQERKAQSTAVHRKSASLVEIGEPSREYVEMGTRSIKEMGSRSIKEMDSAPVEDDRLTLPSRTMSPTPSRHLSLNSAASPPAYYDGKENPVRTVRERDEKTGSIGYT